MLFAEGARKGFLGVLALGPTFCPRLCLKSQDRNFLDTKYKALCPVNLRSVHAPSGQLLRVIRTLSVV